MNSGLRLVDIHCHMDGFKNAVRIVQEAKGQNVWKIISNSTDINSIKKNLKLSQEFDEIEIALGLHPSDILRMSAKEIDEGFSAVEKNISNAVAVGEVGLDYKHAQTKEQRQLQQECFEKFIELAQKKSKPLVVHTRLCSNEALATLESFGCKKVLMHWFTHSVEDAKRAAELGYFISAGPSVIFSKETQKIVSSIPLENLTLETDAPVSFERKTSKPSWIPRVAQKVAELKKITFEEVAENTTLNAVRLLNLQKTLQ